MANPAPQDWCIQIGACRVVPSQEDFVWELGLFDNDDLRHSPAA